MSARSAVGAVAAVLMMATPTYAQMPRQFPAEPPFDAAAAMDKAYALGVRAGEGLAREMARRDKILSDTIEYARKCRVEPGCFEPPQN